MPSEGGRCFASGLSDYRLLLALGCGTDHRGRLHFFAKKNTIQTLPTIPPPIPSKLATKSWQQRVDTKKATPSWGRLDGDKKGDQVRGEQNCGGGCQLCAFRGALGLGDKLPGVR